MDEMTIEKAAGLAMERLQRLHIQANYETMTMLTGVLEQLQWIREESRRLNERIQELEKPDENPGGAD